MKPVELFHIGPQKTGTTWVYRCLQEHPQVATPPRDSIHFFDMFYANGRNWYEQFFVDARPGQKLLDPTPSYIRSPHAPARIAKENPKAKLVITLRHPIERAFSHYWHEKKKRSITFDFADIVDNYDLFANWLEPGFYACHVERYLKYFPREQILCQLFDDLEREPRNFLRQLLEFFEIDTDFAPSVLHTKVNVAAPPEPFVKRIMKRGFKKTGLLHFAIGTKAALRGSRPGTRPNPDKVNRKMARLAGVSPGLIEQLNKICEPEIAQLEHLLGINLEAWRGHGS